MKKEEYIEIGRYRIYQDGDLFLIYSAMSEKKATCTNLETAKYIAKLYNNDDDIMEKAKELNSIKEPTRDRTWRDSLPSNDNRKHLVLDSELAKATKEFLQKQK